MYNKSNLRIFTDNTTIAKSVKHHCYHNFNIITYIYIYINLTTYKLLFYSFYWWTKSFLLSKYDVNVAIISININNHVYHLSIRPSAQYPVPSRAGLRRRRGARPAGRRAPRARRGRAGERDLRQGGHWYALVFPSPYTQDIKHPNNRGREEKGWQHLIMQFNKKKKTLFLYIIWNQFSKILKLDNLSIIIE